MELSVQKNAFIYELTELATSTADGTRKSNIAAPSQCQGKKYVRVRIVRSILGLLEAIKKLPANTCKHVIVARRAQRTCKLILRAYIFRVAIELLSVATLM